MKSGLRDRNNSPDTGSKNPDIIVSMKSGLRDRNNLESSGYGSSCGKRLNEVRS